MMANIPAELSRFCNCTKRLRTILADTKRCFEDINEDGRNEVGQLFTVELLQEEEQEVLSTATKPPGIVILGQNIYTKGRLINEIFNRTLFPVDFTESEKHANYRMVRFKHGHNLSVSLQLPDDYDLVDNLESYKGPWKTIPRKDLEINDNEIGDTALSLALLEVNLNHVLLRHGARVIVSPSAPHCDIRKVYADCVEEVSPIILYCYEDEILPEKDILLLRELSNVSHYQPVCFVRVPPPGLKNLDMDPPDGAPSSQEDIQKRCQREATSEKASGYLSSSVDEPVYKVMPDPTYTNVPREITLKIQSNSEVFRQLCKIGYLNDSPGVRNMRHTITSDYYEVDSEFVENFELFPQKFLQFVQQILQRYLVNSSTVLNNSHARCLNMFIISAFDMARDMLITPKKLEFAREKENELFKQLLTIAVEKGDEIRKMIAETIGDMRDQLIRKAEEYEFLGVDLNEEGEILTQKGLKICTYQIQELVLGALNQAVATKLMESINILRDSYTGTLTRCLESLERIDKTEGNGSGSTCEALKQIMNAAYQVEISLQSSSSFIRVILERMKQLVQSMPWSAQPKIDLEWKRKAASDMLSSLSEARLAKNISNQIKERLNKSHDSFATALKQLEQKHCGRLDRIEEGRLKLRKVHAPRVAKVALESTSLMDVILHGMPQMGREIGRGQYGVVYSCDSWGGCSPCAIKSVVPPDDKHWNDLALEFYYTKNIPEHERIVALRGSVIDYMYGGGSTPAVLLIMDRLQKDLYGAIKQGLDWLSRIIVAIDVVEGIRFLHSQGLVHRDIKLKNVLLDKENRAKLTDLGFCKPEAMMSGSIVGTPIHMAPELFTGRYDSSVDVYAFGVLFWYVCAGNVKLPAAFEQCANKDQLWQNVKKGLRPEKLAVFDEECWTLMQECWDGDTMKRPLLGNVEKRLHDLLATYRKSQVVMAKAQSKPLTRRIPSSGSRTQFCCHPEFLESGSYGEYSYIEIDEEYLS
ncbi:dual serine/threonine and tyrosine protein kinase-like isoform X2 [Ostrea edulis]|uniref:dual serine/threonine and tyrosine protein kinase-like isoform X2 n=1 Tax=Ostrea edulis TaxID=37623 RepID=UPI00209515F8|nr:dual serine/threonine and tyrosine protein kinase-like isoform X2 [Ostrea edulis]